MSHKIRGVTSSTYVQMMSHTGAVNIGMLLGVTGRVIPSSSACTSGSQAIGFAYETIQQGKQTVMIAGGAEELSVGPIAVFDTMYGASLRNDAPHTTPRPFDRDRDGLVIGEGAGDPDTGGAGACAGPRRAHPCRARGFRHQLRRRAHDPAIDRRPWCKPCSWR